MECGDVRVLAPGSRHRSRNVRLKDGARKGGGNPDCVYVAASVRDREAVTSKTASADTALQGPFGVYI